MVRPRSCVAFMTTCDEAMATWKVGAVMTLSTLGTQGNSRALEFLLEAPLPAGVRASLGGRDMGTLTGSRSGCRRSRCSTRNCLTTEELATVMQAA